MKPFGFGIVGTGVISHFHAKAISEIGCAGIIGVYNHNISKAELFSKIYGGKVYPTLDDMLGNPDIDIVSVCTPSGTHLEIALKCIAAGKHCMIEKPLEITTGRCDLIIEAAKAANVKVAVIFPSRFYEVNRQLKRSVEEQRFGELVLGSAYVKWHRTKEYYQSGEWRGTWQYDGGGALMNQGIHSVDLLQWVMGPIKSVQAISANRYHKEIQVEDTVTAIMTFANGALGVIECTTAAFPGFFKRLEIIGTSGSAILEENSVLKWQFQNELSHDEVFRNKQCISNNSSGGVADPVSISHYGHKMQMIDFINAVEENSDPLVDAVEGKKSVEIVTAIYRSAKSGEKIVLNTG